MFTISQKGDVNPKAAETFIGPSVKLEGNFAADGDVVVEGVLTGNLLTRGDIRVGPQAVIEAEVRAKNAFIAGKIKGNITIENILRLASTASVHGDVRTAAIAVEEGATINGKVSIGKEKEVREMKFSPEPEPAVIIPDKELKLRKR